jgi:hypothetical protein
MVAQQTLTLEVAGSSPAAPANLVKDFRMTKQDGYAQPFGRSANYDYSFHRTDPRFPERSLCGRKKLDLSTLVDDPPDGTLCGWCSGRLWSVGLSVPASKSR